MDQIHNFLRYWRGKQSSTSGSSMCLPDFDDFYAAHKEVPENPDKMFVTKMFVNAHQILNI